MNDVKKLISRLNLACEGLEKANECIKCEDENGALKEIVRHFRNREKPVYLFDDKEVTEFYDPEVIGEADKICDHFIFGYQLGKEIDWRFNPTVSSSKDPEWAWSLFRHTYWITLARAYVMTKDEKYAREFVYQMKSFIRSWPIEEFINKIHKEMGFPFPGHAWRTIETGIRMYTSWFPAMVYFRKSPSWDDEGWVCFLNSIFDHAEFLCTHYSNHERSSNWFTMESSGLFQIGVMFPEFIHTSQWKNLGYRRVTHEVRYQFDHEGVHMERTPIYHLTAAGTFLQAYRLSVLNNIPVPPYMLPILEKSAEYLMKLVKPDFTTPMIGDADRNSLLDRRSDTSVYEGMNLTADTHDLNELRAFFKEMADLTGREDFRYFATNRREGKPPEEKYYSMPDQGFHIMRTGWDEKDSYYLVTGVQLERGERSAHSHQDAGHFELQVDGEDILIDTGRYIYNNAAWKEWRAYFLSQRAHNTILVDEHEMGKVPDTPVRVRGVRSFCHKFESGQDFDVIEVSHNGYAFMEDPVFHLRRVFYLKPDMWIVDDILTGAGNHDYKLYYNFAPGTLREISQDTLSYMYTADKVSVDISPILVKGMSSNVLIGSTDPIGGWVSYGYPVRVPAPQLIYTKKGELPARFITIISRTGSTSVSSSHSPDESLVEIDVKGSAKWHVKLGMEHFEIKKG